MDATGAQLEDEEEAELSLDEESCDEDDDHCSEDESGRACRVSSDDEDHWEELSELDELELESESGLRVSAV